METIVYKIFILIIIDVLSIDFFSSELSNSGIVGFSLKTAQSEHTWTITLLFGIQIPDVHWFAVVGIYLTFVFVFTQGVVPVAQVSQSKQDGNRINVLIQRQLTLLLHTRKCQWRDQQVAKSGGQVASAQVNPSFWTTLKAFFKLPAANIGEAGSRLEIHRRGEY